jgi:hypothetical protein
MESRSAAVGVKPAMPVVFGMDLDTLDAASVYFSSANVQTDEAARTLILRPHDICRNALLAHFGKYRSAALHLVNPHFARAFNDPDKTLVLHFSSLALSCPVPGATNVQVVGRQEVSELLLERMDRQHTPLRQRVLSVMQHILLAEPLDYLMPGVAEELFHGHSLLRLPGDLWADARTSKPVSVRPVAYLAGSFHTGPYNYLEQPGTVARGSIHLQILVDAAKSRNRPYAVLAADPGSIGEAGLMMRIFRALDGQGIDAELLVLFFGTQHELREAIRQHPEATFFGDNIESRNVRFLFSPFATADIIHVLREAAMVFDTAYVTSIGPLADALKLRRRYMVAPDGRYAAWTDGIRQRDELGIGELFSDVRLRQRGRKIDRQAERRLLQELAGALTG